MLESFRFIEYFKDGNPIQMKMPREGTASWVIRQGEEMGRPSRLALEADFAGGKLTAVRLGGSAVRMTQGALRIAAAG